MKLMSAKFNTFPYGRSKNSGNRKDRHSLPFILYTLSEDHIKFIWKGSVSITRPQHVSQTRTDFWHLKRGLTWHADLSARQDTAVTLYKYRKRKNQLSKKQRCRDKCYSKWLLHQTISILHLLPNVTQIWAIFRCSHVTHLGRREWKKILTRWKMVTCLSFCLLLQKNISTLDLLICRLSLQKTLQCNSSIGHIVTNISTVRLFSFRLSYMGKEEAINLEFCDHWRGSGSTTSQNAKLFKLSTAPWRRMRE